MPRAPGGKTRVALPEGEFTDMLTGDRVAPGSPLVADLLGRFPGRAPGPSLNRGPADPLKKPAASGRRDLLSRSGNWRRSKDDRSGAGTASCEWPASLVVPTGWGGVALPTRGTPGFFSGLLAGGLAGDGLLEYADGVSDSCFVGLSVVVTGGAGALGQAVVTGCSQPVPRWSCRCAAASRSSRASGSWSSRASTSPTRPRSSRSMLAG